MSSIQDDTRTLEALMAVVEDAQDRGVPPETFKRLIKEAWTQVLRDRLLSDPKVFD